MLAQLASKEFIYRAMRYGTVGVVSHVVYFAFFIGLTEIGMHYLISSVFAFGGFWLTNFLLHRNWTFKSSGNMGVQGVQHLGLFSANHLLVMLGLYILVDLVGVYYIYAQIILSTIVIIEVFVLSHFIFRN